MRRPARVCGGLVAALALGACLDTGTDPDRPLDFTFPVPLTDVGVNTYREQQGGLYPGGANTIPEAHAAEGRRRATLVRPLNADGQPDPQGRIVVLSAGFDNASEEFCAQQPFTTCNEWSFVGQAEALPSFDGDRVALVNGAQREAFVDAWDQASDAAYDRVRDSGLVPRGLSEQQVQVVWLKLAPRLPGITLPGTGADAYVLATGMSNAARALRARYPNLQMIFVSSRSFGGFSVVPLSPEPYAFETGFAVKWLIESQIRQVRGEPAPPRVSPGNLDYRSGAPWLAWGPYLWSGDINNIRSDGFYWDPVDFESDGVHPSDVGERKVAEVLLNFFTTSEFTACWFVRDRSCS